MGRSSSGAAGKSAVDEEHLDWSSKQGRILTFAGRAVEFYREDLFTVDELPHYELNHGQAEETFRRWSADARTGRALDARRAGIVGAWNRPLFLGRGGFENTSDAVEHVFNMQSPGLFIDLRIPVRRKALVNSSGSARGFSDLSDLELRYLARQHVFGGFSRIVAVDDSGTISRRGTRRFVCTRHHFVDWNYIGHARNRPNKWYIEHPGLGSGLRDVWMEHSFTNHFDTGQPYYSERWSRHNGDDSGKGIVISCISRKGTAHALLIVIGNRFSFVLQPHDRGLAAGAGRAGAFFRRTLLNALKQPSKSSNAVA